MTFSLKVAKGGGVQPEGGETSSYAELSFGPHIIPLRGSMVKILDICWNVTNQHRFWIQILLIYNEYLFASKENTISQWNYGQIEVAFKNAQWFIWQIDILYEQASTMLHFELLQS